jgi:hypothetical protein
VGVQVPPRTQDQGSDQAVSASIRTVMTDLCWSWAWGFTSHWDTLSCATQARKGGDHRWIGWRRHAGNGIPDFADPLAGHSGHRLRMSFLPRRCPQTDGSSRLVGLVRAPDADLDRNGDRPPALPRAELVEAQLRLDRRLDAGRCTSCVARPAGSGHRGRTPSS